MTADQAAENARLQHHLGRLNWRHHHALARVTHHLDHTEPCAVLAADIRAILEGRRDPKTPP